MLVLLTMDLLEVFLMYPDFFEYKKYFSMNVIVMFIIG